MQFALATVVLLCSLFSVGASTPSYWFSGFQVKPDAKQAQAYFFLEGTNILLTYTNNRVIINSTGGGGGGTNVGPQGPQGIAGTNGIGGTNGTNGASGTNGAPGISGTNGAAGQQGPAGTNAASGIVTNIWTTNALGTVPGNLVNETVSFSKVIQGQTTNVIDYTNSIAQTINFGSASYVEGDFSTNAAFAWLGYSGLVDTLYQTAIIWLTNSTGSAFAFTAPANTHLIGTFYVTNLTEIIVKRAPGRTNMFSLPLW